MIDHKSSVSRPARSRRTAHAVLVLLFLLAHLLILPSVAAGGDPSTGGSTTAYRQNLAIQNCGDIRDTPDIRRQSAAARQASVTTRCVVIQGVGIAITKTADASPVSLGDTIGFTIIVTSTGDMTASGVTVVDLLPAGAGMSWSIDAAGSDLGCGIGSGILTCNFGDLPSLQSRRVHITSPTMGICGTISNTARVTTTNDGSGAASASIFVQCSGLIISKTADSPSVNAGDPIGFTVTISNTGAGTASNVVLTDTLPLGPGLAWSLSAPVSGCALAGNILECSFGNLTSGITRTLHLSSPTTAESCGVYSNTARATAGNQVVIPASASTQVNCPNACPNQIFGVNVAHGLDAQFFTIDPATLAVSPLGPLYVGADLDGLDIDPVTHQLYATAGDDNRLGQDGYLFRVDSHTGALTPVGFTGFSEVVGLSFHPDGTLWGWARGTGLIRIDPATAASTLVFHSFRSIKGLAWNNDGTMLYGSRHDQLYLIDPVAGTLTLLADNLPEETSGLEIRPDGLLAATADERSTIFAYDISTRHRVPSEYIDLSGTEFEDIESLAWPSCVVINRP
jgi:uncharacterized repeat protein (TIGR01451 family)